MVYISGGNELLNPQKVLEKMGVKVGWHIADLGCGGAGHFIIPAAQRVGTQGMAYAVDILKSVLQAVSSKARLEGVNNIKTVWSNLEASAATKIPEGSLDTAFLINMLFQSKQHSSILKEAQRLLKPKSQLLIIDWNRASASLGPALESRVDPESIKADAKALNLSLVEEFSPGEYHFGLIFQKN